MKKRLRVLGGVLALTALAAAPAWASHETLLTLIPGDNLTPEWVRSGKPRLCADEACLSDRLDGAAPYYFKLGLFIAAYQYYIQKGSVGELNLEIFWMKTFSDAKFLYEDLGKKAAQSSAPPKDFKIGEGGRLLSAPGLYYLEYYLGPYYIRIESRGEGKAPEEALLKMARKIAQDIEEGKGK